MMRNFRPVRFLGFVAVWFILFFVIDTAFTLWIRKEPYSLPRALGSSLLLAVVFVLLDRFFDPFGRKKRMNE